MQLVNEPRILTEDASLLSQHLDREVKLSCFVPQNIAGISHPRLLLINDGQDMERMGFGTILDRLYAEDAILPMLYVAIHAGAERRMEYGTQHEEDFKGRGALAGAYDAFIFEELLPFIIKRYRISGFSEKSFAGFSLGALSALDVAWNHPGEFSTVGLFSGSLWWRSVDQDQEEYDDDKHRIMHQQVRKGQKVPGLKFFFQCGNMDETKDRNNHGIIDSIDDTLDLMRELEAKGYDPEKDMYYLELPDGHHDVTTWGRAMPVFLKWGWAK